MSANVLDLTHLSDLDIRVELGHKTYVADPDISAVLYERVVTWLSGLLQAEPAKADEESISLVADVYRISVEESKALRPRWRRDMLNHFFLAQNAPLTTPEPAS